MVCIVLYIQANKGLGHTINDGHGERRLSAYPYELQIEEKRDVAEGTKIPSGRSKFTSSANDLENFLLDLSLERRVEIVPA